MLVLTIVKALIVVPVALEYGQQKQAIRGVVIVVVFLALVKVLLYKPSTVKIISHILIVGGIVVIWSNLLVYVQHVNIFTVQMIFMITLISYYLIGGYKAAVYSAFAITPVLYYWLTKGTMLAHFNFESEEMVAPAINMVILLNFVTFVVVHYLYYKAFHYNLREKILLNKQLQANILEAKALAESRSVFLSTMSHELRTPLNGVIGMTHLIQDSAMDSQREYLNALEFSATNLMSVVNDILDYNKIELNKIELEALPVNLPVLMKKICTGLELKAAEKGLAWKLEVDNVLNKFLVVTDPTRLTQIIYNLAGNAIKFTDNGSVGVCIIVTSRTDKEISIRFEISDTGIGIATHRQEAIFEMFTQASADTTRKYGGTGLGLSIVKKLLALFHSHIELSSQPEEGSIFAFTILFPVYEGEAEAVADYGNKPLSLKGMKILIAEDNNINVLLLQRLLTKWDVQTVVAANGRDAVDKVMAETFDAILMDIHMPVMDGYEATLAIRKLSDPLKAQIPIIAITASVSHNVYSVIQKAGMQDFLPKPFQPEHLYEKMQQLNKQVL